MSLLSEIVCNGFKETTIGTQRRLNICSTIDPFQCPIDPAVKHKVWKPFVLAGNCLRLCCLLIDDEWHFNEPKAKGVRCCLMSKKKKRKNFFRFAIFLYGLKQFSRNVIFCLKCFSSLFCSFFSSSSTYTKGARKQLGEISLWDFSLTLVLSSFCFGV